MQPIVSDSQDQYVNPKGILDLGIPFNSPQLPHSDTSEKEFEAPQSVWAQLSEPSVFVTWEMTTNVYVRAR